MRAVEEGGKGGRGQQHVSGALQQAGAVGQLAVVHDCAHFDGCDLFVGCSFSCSWLRLVVLLLCLLLQWPALPGCAAGRRRRGAQRALVAPGQDAAECVMAAKGAGAAVSRRGVTSVVSLGVACTGHPSGKGPVIKVYTAYISHSDTHHAACVPFAASVLVPATWPSFGVLLWWSHCCARCML